MTSEYSRRERRKSVRQEQLERLLESWRRFNERFPDEESCIVYVNSMVGNGVTNCPYCSNEDLSTNLKERSIRCNSCRRFIYPTAGSYFHGIRKLRPWLARIYFFEEGVSVSSSMFARMLGIASSTAQTIFKKLSFVLVRRLNEFGIDVFTEELLASVCKRSLKTPADEHPRAEETVLAEASLDAQTEEEQNFDHNLEPAGTGAQTKNSFSESEIGILTSIGDVPISLNEICVRTELPTALVATDLTLLELRGLVTKLSGGSYARVATHLSLTAPYHHNRATSKSEEEEVSGQRFSDSVMRRLRVIEGRIDDFLFFIHLFFHGISRKYMQSYLGAHWCFADRESWGEQTLFRECFSTRRARCHEILEYESPLNVRMSRIQSGLLD